MIRAFLALPLPDALRDRLENLALDLGDGRPVAWENFHVTLAFLGELPGPDLEDAAWELERLRAPSPTVALEGLGVFGGRRPRSVHALIRPDPALKTLRRAVRDALRRGGLDLPRERFTPHVTLARFSSRAPAGESMARWLSRHAAFSAAPVSPKTAVLYRSWLGEGGPRYEALMETPLGDAAAPPDARFP